MRLWARADPGAAALRLGEQGAHMQLPLQITFHGLSTSSALETTIRRRAAWLERVHSRVVSCRVAVERNGNHHRHGRQFNVRIDVKVPGQEIVVNRGHDEEVHLAVRDAFDAARRQLSELRAAPNRESTRHPA
jgi:ribosome-associated translation inhibitor RaiA